MECQEGRDQVHGYMTPTRDDVVVHGRQSTERQNLVSKTVTNFRDQSSWKPSVQPSELLNTVPLHPWFCFLRFVTLSQLQSETIKWKIPETNKL